MPRLTTSQAISQFMKMLEQVKALRNEDAKEGLKAKFKLEKRLSVLVKMAFDDHEEKRKEYDRTGLRTTSEQAIDEIVERTKYLTDLRIFESTIEIYLEELVAMREFEQSNIELAEKSASLEKAKNEAEKGGEIVAGRIYNEAIDMLQRLKDEMKGRNDIALEMTEVKGRLLSAEEMINLLIEHTNLGAYYDLEAPQEDNIDPELQAQLEQEQAEAEAEVMQELAEQQYAEEAEMMQELAAEEAEAEQEFAQEQAAEEAEFMQEQAGEEVELAEEMAAEKTDNEP